MHTINAWSLIKKMKNLPVNIAVLTSSFFFLETKPKGV